MIPDTVVYFVTLPVRSLSISSVLFATIHYVLPSGNWQLCNACEKLCFERSAVAERHVPYELIRRNDAIKAPAASPPGCDRCVEHILHFLASLTGKKTTPSRAILALLFNTDNADHEHK